MGLSATTTRRAPAFWQSRIRVETSSGLDVAESRGGEAKAAFTFDEHPVAGFDEFINAAQGLETRSPGFSPGPRPL